MKFKTSIIAVLIYLTFANIQMQAQDNFNMWYQYLMSAKLTKSNLTILSQYRSFDLAFDARLFLVSAYYDYEVTNNFKPAIGMMYLNITPYIDDFSKKSRHEIRPFQQVTYDINVGKVSFSNRFRIEERFISNPDVFILRVRYLLSIRFPLLTLNEKEKLYGVFKNEIRINVINDDVFDSDRITLGLGLRMTKKSAIEISYINQLETNKKNHYAYIGYRNYFDWRKTK